MFDVNALLNSLPIMGKGMAGIFIVTAVIVITVSALNKIGSRNEQ